MSPQHGFLSVVRVPRWWLKEGPKNKCSVGQDEAAWPFMVQSWMSYSFSSVRLCWSSSCPERRGNIGPTSGWVGGVSC